MSIALCSSVDGIHECGRPLDHPGDHECGRHTDDGAVHRCGHTWTKENP